MRPVLLNMVDSTGLRLERIGIEIFRLSQSQKLSSLLYSIVSAIPNRFGATSILSHLVFRTRHYQCDRDFITCDTSWLRVHVFLWRVRVHQGHQTLPLDYSRNTHRHSKGIRARIDKIWKRG